MTLRALVWNEAEGRPAGRVRIVSQLLLFIASLMVVGSLVPGRSTGLGWEVLRGLLAGLVLVGILWLYARLIDRRPFAGFGLRLDRAWWLDLLAGFALGGLLMGGIFAAERAAGWVAVTGRAANPFDVPFPLAMLAALVAFAGFAFAEEATFRSYQIPNFAETFGEKAPARRAVVLAWVLSSFIFGLMHWSNEDASAVSSANLFISTFLLEGLAFVLTGRLGLSLGHHLAWNFFQGNVFGFPVSGMDAGLTWLVIRQGGPELWTGGAFGPEAGLVGTLASVAGAGLILLWVRWREGRVALRTELARYRPPRSVVEA